MKARSAIGLAGALAFALPTAPARSGGIELALCNGGTVRVPLDQVPGDDDHRCCGKACHAGDRKRKAKNLKGEGPDT